MNSENVHYYRISLPKFSLVFALLISILLVTWIGTYFLHAWWYFRTNIYYDFPEASHATPQPDENSLTVGISGKRIIIGNGFRETDISNFQKTLFSTIEDYGLKNPRILMKIDTFENTRWGIVVDVLKEIKKSKIDSVVLITKGYAYYHDHIKEKSRTGRAR